MNTNAWREVLARVFESFAAQYDVSPDWLINPDTKRRLKLDVLYSDIGVAIRFQGLKGRGRRQRPSLEEEYQQKARDVARADLCQANGFNLVTVDVISGEPKATVRELRTALSSASRRLAKSHRPQAEKGVLIEQVSQARSRLEAIARRLRRSEDLNLYAELWQDRQYMDTPQPEPPSPNGPSLTYAPGMTVRHSAFGNGVVHAIRPDGDDRLVTVHFTNGTQKTFAASLVSDKLLPNQ